MSSLKALGERSGSRTGSAGRYSSRTGGRAERLAVLVGQEQHRLLGVPDLALDEEGLVVLDQGDDVAAGDVAVVDDGEAGGVEVEADGQPPRRAGMVVRIVRPWSIPGKRRSST